MKILIIILGALVGFQTFWYIRYRHFFWELHMYAIRTSSSQTFLTFKEQYNRHKTMGWINGTHHLSFNSFVKFYKINPSSWDIQEYEFGDRLMNFAIVYLGGAEKIKVIFSKRDFNKYRRWLAKRQFEKFCINQDRIETEDIQHCQIIINGVKKDIEVIQAQALAEVQKAQKMLDKILK